MIVFFATDSARRFTAGFSLRRSHADLKDARTLLDDLVG